ncbi:small ribosomal subunit protein uS2m-like [Lineus longissimus]|uniref:small ribosomal subunit protein uS2m-like n=1 Tax=Lineus longissimus TaxID=88925 RepID=UPI002B4E000A
MTAKMAASMKVVLFRKFLQFSGRLWKPKLWRKSVTTPIGAVSHARSFSVSSYMSDGAVPKQESLQSKEGEMETKIINPSDHEDYFGVKEMVSLKDLFDAKVHLGHKAGSRHQYMVPYIFGSRLNCDIIDLEQTVELLHDALNFTGHIAFRKGIILFVSRSYQMLPEVEKTAFDCGEYSHCRFWQGGVFANATIQFNAITRLPDVCIFINTLNPILDTHIGIADAGKLNIPTIGILDTNCDPRLITYPVPGNDDTPSAVRLYLRLFKDVIMKAKAKRKELEEKGYIIQLD